MLRLMIFGLTLVAVILVAVPSGQAIQRVAPKYSFVEFYWGAGLPTGSYDNILNVIYFTDGSGRPIEIDADDLYDAGFFIGASYGQVLRGHLVASVGLRYGRVNVDDDFPFFTVTPRVHLYDVQFNANWMFLDLNESAWSPYVGAGVRTGFLGRSYSGYDTEYDATIDFGLNFGVDVKLWKSADSPQFVTLSSINNWSLATSDVRPRNINIGLGVKYYFK